MVVVIPLVPCVQENSCPWSGDVSVRREGAGALGMQKSMAGKGPALLLGKEMTKLSISSSRTNPGLEFGGTCSKF